MRLVAPSACIEMALQAQPLLAQTSEAGQCEMNYSEQCVPIASDVDCAGSKGNGPAYVSGPVYVVSADICGLDHDKNGIGCEEPSSIVRPPLTPAPCPLRSRR